MNIKIESLSTGFEGGFCFMHARAASGPNGFGIMTTQLFNIARSDVFYGMQTTMSNDGGKTWSPIVPSKTLVRFPVDEKYEQCMSDATPIYHKKTGKYLLLGHEVRYLDDRLMPSPRPRHTLWSVYDADKGDWEYFRELKMPGEDAKDKPYFSCGNGSGQSVILDNGDILIPVYYRSYEAELRNIETGEPARYSSTVVRCQYDGKDLTVVEIGNSNSIELGRGLYEPSIIDYRGEFFMTLRNDLSGYLTRSRDGLNYDKPVPLCFDDGENVGSYNTQQHWIRGGGKLWLVYTRKGANNDHIPRHRAPLFICEVDTERMCLLRATEEVVVPERGAMLGNFGCTHVSENESWVVAAECMAACGPTGWDKCRERGSNNNIFVTKVTF